MMPWSLGFPPQGCGSSTVGGSPQHVPRKLLGEESQETPVTFWAPLKGHPTEHQVKHITQGFTYTREVGENHR